MDTSTTARDAYSAEFLAAVERVLAEEGGYSSNAADPGGATNFGISARAHPGLDIAALTRDAAIEIYWREWWLRFGFAQLPAAPGRQDFRSQRQHRRPLRDPMSPARFARVRDAVTEDGVLDPATAIAARRADPAALMAALRSEFAAHYRLVAANQKHGADFLNGWLNRAYA